jgi:acid phosphatase
VQRDRDGSVLPSLPKVWGGMVPNTQDIGGKKYGQGRRHQGLAERPVQTGRHRRQAAAGSRDHARPVAPVLPEPDADQRRQERRLRRMGQHRRHGDGLLRRDRKNLGLWKIAEQYTLCDNFFMAALAAPT